MQEGNVGFSETLQYRSFLDYLTEMFSGWRWKLMVFLWGLPLSLVGIYELIHSEWDAPPLGEILSPEWWIIWFLLWVCFLMLLSFILLGINSHKKIKIIQSETSHKIKNIDILHQYYGNRMELPQLIADLVKCVSEIIDKQKIPRLPRGKMSYSQGFKYLSIILSLFFKANVFKVAILYSLNTITFSNPRIFTKTKNSLFKSILHNIDLALSDYNLGSIPTLKNPEYLVKYEQIKSLEVGMPPQINAKINDYIRRLNSMNCLILAKPERNYWKDVKFSKMLTRPLRLLLPMLDDVQSQMIGEVSQDIRNFLGVG